jgi:hypothetical protein
MALRAPTPRRGKEKTKTGMELIIIGITLKRSHNIGGGI